MTLITILTTFTEYLNIVLKKKLIQFMLLLQFEECNSTSKVEMLCLNSQRVSYSNHIFSLHLYRWCSVLGYKIKLVCDLYMSDNWS